VSFDFHILFPESRTKTPPKRISTPPPPRPDSSLSRQPSVPRSTSHPPVPPTEPPPPAPEPQPEIELSLPTSPPPIEQMIAERRAKRLAILAKYQDQNIPSSQSATASPAPGPVTENKEEPATKVKHDGESNGRMATPAAGSDGMSIRVCHHSTSIRY
jgi:serine/threonine-protein kinase PRP4